MHLKLKLLFILIFCAVGFASTIAVGEDQLKKGKNMFPEQALYDAEDNGINILLDHAHQFTFFTAWDIPPLLREGGFRVIGSQAVLNSVLDKDGTSRVRFGDGKKRPFGKWENADYNVIITYQHDPNSQKYLPEEIDAVLEFVGSGGGLIMIGGGVHSDEKVKRWPINSLADKFGAKFSNKAAIPPFDDEGEDIAEPLEYPDSGRFTGLLLDESWKALVLDKNDIAVLAVREFKKGRVAIISDLNILKWGRESPKNKTKSKKANGIFMHNLVNWCAANKPPVGGSRALPTEAWGGGAIYPEIEADIGNITVFYARNQRESSLKVISEDMPDVKDQIEAWLPSAPPPGRMYLVLSSGGGGGWAINVYEPKEVGIISLDPEGILSVFAHELAHTMAGPPNDSGEVAGILPGLHSEAHAGWFQGKIEAMRTGKRKGHDPNRMFDDDPDGKSLDIANLSDKKGEYRKGWKKLWWIWQKLDEKYGITWYPRWLWVKNMRWKDEPDRRLSWDDVVEDMSIAVGEDLFPFFNIIGTGIYKECYPKAEFLGKEIELPVAEIEISRSGDALLGAIGDFKAGLH